MTIISSDIEYLITDPLSEESKWMAFQPLVICSLWPTYLLSRGQTTYWSRIPAPLSALQSLAQGSSLGLILRHLPDDVLQIQKVSGYAGQSATQHSHVHTFKHLYLDVPILKPPAVCCSGGMGLTQCHHHLKRDTQSAREVKKMKASGMTAPSKREDSSILFTGRWLGSSTNFP